MFLAGQIAIAAFATFVASTSAVSSLLFQVSLGVLVSQYYLIGIWLGLGTTHVFHRVAGGLTALCLIMICHIITHCSANQISLISYWSSMCQFPLSYLGRYLVMCLPALTFGLLLRVASKRFVRIVRFSNNSPPAMPDTIRFSTRDLLTWTAAVSIGVTIMRGMRVYFPGETMLLRELCWMCISMLALWATLGIRRPNVRIVVAVLLSIGLACLYIYGTGMVGLGYYYRWAVRSVAMAGFSIISLLTIRRGGFRFIFVRRLAAFNSFAHVKSTSGRLAT